MSSVNLDRLRGMLQTAAGYYHEHLLSNDPKAQVALLYAREKRGFSDATIHEFLIGYAPAGWSMMLDALKKVGFTENEMLDAGLLSKNDNGRVYDRFRNRLMIPIRDEHGRVTGFGARAIDPEDTPKYLNSPQSVLFDKSRTLFGLDMAKNAISDSGMAVIVEGYMGAIQAHQAGFRNVVAQMGTALTETQIKLLVPRHTKKIILALDADAAGQNDNRRLLEVARATFQADYTGKLGADIRIVQVVDSDDMVRETPERWQIFINVAKPVADFFINEKSAQPVKPAVQEQQLTALEAEIGKSTNQNPTPKELHIYANLRFNSPPEIAIAQALDRRGVMYFANCVARVGPAGRRENVAPDFLINYRGKWGVMEVDGSTYHSNRASEDYDRKRKMEKHGGGIAYFDRYDAMRCLREPDAVVKEFLDILSQK